MPTGVIIFGMLWNTTLVRVAEQLRVVATIPLGLAALSFERLGIDTLEVLQAAAPAYESARLFSVFGVGIEVVRGFALLLIAASALGLFVALTQALEASHLPAA